ncbi:MAG: T9SS type A sorting domain-containing protein [Flavobacterium sp.]|nr:T9SS type A sorting domain-containing protein [Flavobacterium sp.]
MEKTITLFTIAQKALIFPLLLVSLFCLHPMLGTCQQTVANWEEINLTPGAVSNIPNIIAIAYGNNTYAAIGYAGGQKSLFTSTDGVNWSLSNFALPLPTSFPDDIVFLDNKFKLVTNGSVYTSTNLESWEYESFHLVFTARNLKKVNTLYFQGGEGNFATSIDGLTWTNPMSGADFLDLEYGNSIYVLVGRQSGKGILYTSTNGVTWTNVFSVADNLDMFYAVDFHDGNFILSGNNGIIGKSVNGVTWTFSTPMGTNNTFFSIRYLLNHWVVSSGFKVYYSGDGVTWTQSTVSGSTGSLRRVEAFNDIGFIPGNTGKIIKTVAGSLSLDNNGKSNELFNIFPNPTTQYVTIATVEGFMTDTIHMNILNSIGQSVKQVAVEPSEMIVDLKELPSGLYYYQISNNFKILKTGKIVKH